MPQPPTHSRARAAASPDHPLVQLALLVAGVVAAAGVAVDLAAFLVRHLV